MLRSIDQSVVNARLDFSQGWWQHFWTRSDSSDRSFSYWCCLASFHLKNFLCPTSVRILRYWRCNTSAVAAAFKKEKWRRKWAVPSLVHRLTSICAITPLDMWFHVSGCLQAGQLHWETGQHIQMTTRGVLFHLVEGRRKWGCGELLRAEAKQAAAIMSH